MNPGNDHPEIPSLKPAAGNPEEKKGTGLTPSAKPAPSSSGFKFPGFGGAPSGASKAFSAPNLKVRGLGGGATVMERLKNLRKKDLIFIAAGLCTLGTAPLAEHLLMSPDEQTAKLDGGFGSSSPVFGGGDAQVAETGYGVGSPGGLVGQGQDIITPLNVRDPSNLIMSPGAQKKADAVVAPPPPPTGPSKGESDWKDVLRDTAKSGAGKAVAQAPRPKPNVGKMAGAIRGLSALGGGGGGTGASLKLDPLSASNVPNRAASSGALTRSQATPGFRGVTSRSNASSGADEALRAAGSKQSDIFNKGGGAAAALDAASREAIPTGGASGGSGGRPGEGGETKNPGGNSHKDNKSLGESLAFLRQKMEMEKSLDLKWERKKWNEFGRQKMLEEKGIGLAFDMFGKFAEKAFINPLADAVGQAVAGGGDQIGWECTMVQGGGRQKFPASGPPNSTRQGSTFYDKNGQPVATNCSKVVLGSGDAGTAPTQPDRRGGGVQAPGGRELGERARQNADQAARLREQEVAISGWRSQIQQACSTMQGNTPALVALKDKVCKLGAEAQNIETGLGSLKTASEKTAAAFEELGKTAQELGKESTSLRNVTTKLQESSTKLQEAYTKLRIAQGQEKLTDEAGAKTAVTAARAAVDAAANDHKTSQVAVNPANQALVNAAQRAQEAQTALDAAVGKLQGQLPPAAAGDEGTTSRYTEYRNAVQQAQTSALESHRNGVTELGRWRGANEIAVDARNKFHGGPNPVSGMENPREAANEVTQPLGAMGDSYNNFVKNQVKLVGKDDASSQLLSASKTEFQKFETAVKASCTDAATRQACVTGEVEKYHAALDAALPGAGAPAGGQPTAPMVGENSARAGAAVQSFTAAYNRLRDVGTSLRSAGGVQPVQPATTAAAAPPATE